MAGKNSLFRILKAKTGGALRGLVGLIPGSDTVAGELAAFVTAFQDSSGNATIPQLNAQGQLPVTLDAGDCLSSGNGNLAGTVTLTEITNSSITLATNTTYKCAEALVSSMAESCFQLVHLDDATENDLLEMQVGPGQYTVKEKFDCLEFTTGGTGTQRIYIKGANATADEAADLKAWIAVLGPNP